MNQPSPSKLRRLHRLAGALLDGNLTDKQQRELAAILRTDGDARSYYVDFMAVHAQLHWRHDGQQQEFPSFGDDEASEFIIEVEPASLLRRKKRYDSIHWQRQKIRFNAMTAVLTALAWVGFSYFIWFSTTPDDSRPEPAGEDFNFVAYISGVYEHQWADEMRPTPPNSSMAAGERLQLAEGLIEITFFGGAVVVLEAPTEFIIDSPRAGTLERGRLTANVPPEAIGFVIDTPEVTITDLGTEFGVEVSRSGIVEVHVLAGSVESRLALRGGGYGAPMLIEADHAIRIPPGAHRIVHIAAEPERFVAAGVFVPSRASATMVTIGTGDGLHVNRVLGHGGHEDSVFDVYFSTDSTGQQSYATISNADLLAAVVAALGPAPVGEEYKITSATFYAGTVADGYTATDVGVYATTSYDPTMLTYNNQPQSGGTPTTTAISFGSVSGSTTSWDVSGGVNTDDDTFLFWPTGSGTEFTKVQDGNPGDVHLVVDAVAVPIPEPPPEAERGEP